MASGLNHLRQEFVQGGELAGGKKRRRLGYCDFGVGKYDGGFGLAGSGRKAF